MQKRCNSIASLLHVAIDIISRHEMVQVVEILPYKDKE